MARDLPASALVAIRMSPSSTTNQIGATWGRPSEATQATLAVRVPVLRNSSASSVVISRMAAPSPRNLGRNLG